MNRLARSAVLLLAASMLAGCSAGGGEAQQEAAPTDPAGSSPVATYPGSGVGFDAAIEGTLQIIDDCLVMGSEDAYVVPVFPDESDVAWNDGTLTWNGTHYEPGDRVSFGGGGTASEDSYIPDGCVGLATVLIGA